MADIQLAYAATTGNWIFRWLLLKQLKYFEIIVTPTDKLDMLCYEIRTTMAPTNNVSGSPWMALLSPSPGSGKAT